MATTYITVDEFKALSVMPSSTIESIESSSPGWIDTQLEYWSAQIDSRLRKRYEVPFASPYPIAVKGWLARIVTVRCFLKGGVDPSDLQFAEVKADADMALAEIKEAADSNTGLFDLPLRENTTDTGVSRGGPFGYSEASPYVWMDGQAETGRYEDSSRRGTGG